MQDEEEDETTVVSKWKAGKLTDITIFDVEKAKILES